MDPDRRAPGIRRVLPLLLCVVAGACSGADAGNPAGPDPTPSPAPAPGQEPEPEPVASVQVLLGRTLVGVIPSGAPQRVTAEVRDRAGHLLARPVTWESSNPDALRVDADGVLTPLRPGATVQVTGTSEGVHGSTTVSVVVYQNDFERQAPGVLTPAGLAETWNAPEWAQGVGEGRVHVVEGDETSQPGRSLRVSFPRGGVGPGEGGGLWILKLDRGYTEIYASYRFRFGPGFQFVQGGKLPGLAGGTGNTGGARPNGRDGWSGRMMWSRNGRLLQYVYHPDQPGSFGESWAWANPQRQPVLAEPGQWYRVEQRVVMNTPGRRDGVMQAWLDGVLVLDRRNVRFREVESFGIDAFQVATFFGGSERDWAPVRDEVLYLDDVVISTVRPGQAAPSPSPTGPPS